MRKHSLYSVWVSKERFEFHIQTVEQARTLVLTAGDLSRHEAKQIAHDRFHSKAFPTVRIYKDAQKDVASGICSFIMEYVMPEPLYVSWLVVDWARTPGIHGQNPYTLPMVREAHKALGLEL